MLESAAAVAPDPALGGASGFDSLRQICSARACGCCLLVDRERCSSVELLPTAWRQSQHRDELRCKGRHY